LMYSDMDMQFHVKLVKDEQCRGLRT